MFKKSASVAFKGETRLRGKEAKKLKEAVALQLGGEDAATAILPSKGDIVSRKAGGGSTAQFFFADGTCILVQLDGRADVGDAELVPSLPALWSIGADALPCVLLQPAVARFISRGANVMAPGIRAVRPARGADAAPELGSLVSVRVVGNPSACAVGRLRLHAAVLGTPGTKGEAVEVLHYFGDALWEACGSPRPAGFVGDEIAITDAREAAELLGATPVGEPAAAGADAASSDKSPFGGAPVGGASAPAEAEDASGAGEMGPEEMDRYLLECFLQAAKTRIKDKDLPMAGNTLYAQHMRGCRRAGSNLDVKQSSKKKLAPFLAQLEELGVLALKKGSADPVVTRICRDHPDVSSWRPWPRSATAEAAAEGGGSEGGSGSAAATIAIETVWRPGARLAPLLDATGVQAPEDGCWTREQLAEVLKRYADAKDLWMKNNRKRMTLDELLSGLAGEGDASSHLDGLVDRTLRSLQVCHRVSTPQGGAQGGVRRTVRPGRPPVVQVRTDTRRGHAVTLAHGLEAYGVDMDALASCLQKALAASASVEREPQVAVVVQGFWDVAVADWMQRIGIPAESIQQQAKKGQQQKKTKQATNIVKH
eukprot:CAMPEP_0175445392 /NCGR_PEP_ID=MMETSP0095-20121207/59725_1 /TAXON_ID=311494 /ORGANISM="Alexandrium monilatum, Strain CCMP3105" /LENGTH=595 /DNA_ID=CAMNT_0016745621 /DNA_START=1 /DNA_END=1788 /DNA_ORIENTATION=-